MVPSFLMPHTCCPMGLFSFFSRLMFPRKSSKPERAVRGIAEPLISSLFTVPAHWSLHGEDAEVAVYANDRGDILSINYFPRVPDITARLDDLDGLRAIFRRTASENKMALIEAETVEIDGLPAVRTLLKSRMEPHGFGFVGSHILPFADRSYVIKAESIERGITGARECAVFMLQEKREADPETGKIIGWEADPYDPAFRGDFMRNCADDPQYDDMIQDHPLSKIRRYLAEVEREVRVADTVRSRDPFVYRAV